ncbi:stromal cell-derived factor 2-like [Scyliorhinus canicula]|uniref:stromal cell-derived factor 2-like n=1 Tax=Scyliorhinus canicula TaxID=7830 RepID=UPI0018F66C23|nr:stromal cell-derived factor 2-like [Scyliorhinus canicula]
MLLSSSSATNRQCATCGSVVKLFNGQQHVHLHSQNVKYWSGSCQQSVTGVVQLLDSEREARPGWSARNTNKARPVRRADTSTLEETYTVTTLCCHSLETSAMLWNQSASDATPPAGGATPKRVIMKTEHCQLMSHS